MQRAGNYRDIIFKWKIFPQSRSITIGRKNKRYQIASGKRGVKDRVKTLPIQHMMWPSPTILSL